MKITKFSSNTLKTISTPSGVQLVREDQMTIGAAPVVVAVPPIDQCYTFLFINRSAGGQIVRCGFAPQFAPNFGISLLANDVVVFENCVYAVSLVASGAGALVDVNVSYQAYK